MEATINFFKTHFGRSREIAPEIRSVPRNNAIPDSVNQVTTGQVVRTLTLLASLLLVANSVVVFVDYLTAYELKSVSRLVKIFSVDYELNVPAFFSTLILVFAAVLLAIITFFKKKQLAPYRWHWAILTCGFVFMAFDEMASIHERLIEPMRTVLGGENLGVLFFAWVVPGMAVVIVLGLVFLRFWWNLPARTRFWVLVAAVLYLAGAIGMELFDGSYAEIHGKKNLTYMMLSTIEEGFEMAGIIVLIKALIEYIASVFGNVVLSFQLPKTKAWQGIR